MTPLIRHRVENWKPLSIEIKDLEVKKDHTQWELIQMRFPTANGLLDFAENYKAKGFSELVLLRVWRFGLFDPCYTLLKSQNRDLMLFVYLWDYRYICILHMCYFSFIMGRVSMQNYFRPQPRSDPLFISVYSLQSTHSILHSMPTILLHCDMTQ